MFTLDHLFNHQLLLTNILKFVMEKSNKADEDQGLKQKITIAGEYLDPFFCLIQFLAIVRTNSRPDIDEEA